MANRSDAEYRMLACMHTLFCHEQLFYSIRHDVDAFSGDQETNRTWKAGQGISSSKAGQVLASVIAAALHVCFELGASC